MSVTLNPLGVSLGFIVVASVVGIYRWMFAAAPRLAPPQRTQGSAHPQARSIIALLSAAPADAQTVDLACQLASERRVRVLLAIVIELPLSLALNASLPEAEARARLVLDAASAVVADKGLSVETRMLRHRKAEAAAVELARETGALAIVTATEVRRHSLPFFGADSFAAYRNAPCQVVLAGAPRAA